MLLDRNMDSTLNLGEKEQELCTYTTRASGFKQGRIHCPCAVYQGLAGTGCGRLTGNCFGVCFRTFHRAADQVAQACMSALGLLLNRLIDYAGLFPPAELAMRPAVENYLQYLRGPNRWMLGRLIVPATRLEEFAAELRTLPIRDDDERPWLVSALVASAGQGAQLQTDLKAVADFNRNERMLARSNATPLAMVDTLEGKAANDGEIAAAVALVPPELALFLELPLGPPLESLLSQLKSLPENRPVMAKVRTGGVVRQAIPAPNQVAAFIAGCASRGLGFKATAGLHHPIRALYRLTYQEDAPSAVMFGFLNVFVATCAAFDNPADLARIEAILSEPDVAQFQFQADAIVWREFRWPSQLVRTARDKGVSFGSCSFQEPVDDLRQLQLLGD